MHKPIDWDDLRFVMSVAEHGSLAAAARALGVNHTTVLRRVNAFEAAQGVRLFDRLPSGYTPTPGGEEMLSAARAMAGIVGDLERRLAGQDLRLEGELRVTTADTLMGSVLPAILAAFQAAHPLVRLEIAATNALANLAARDADVAIRAGPNPPESLIGRRAVPSRYALYARPDVAGTAREAMRWIAPDATMDASYVGRWSRANLPVDGIVMRADSLVSMREAARAGIGATVLPCYLGDSSAGLVRLGAGPVEGLDSAIWVLTHRDLKRTARVTAFAAHVAKCLAARRALFEGLEPRGQVGAESVSGAM